MGRNKVHLAMKIENAKLDVKSWNQETAKKIAKSEQILMKYYLPGVGRAKKHGGHVFTSARQVQVRKLKS